MPVVATLRVDWFRIITDITRSGVALYEIARELDVSKSTVVGWKQGSEPSHHAGEALIDFWCFITHRARAEAPVQVISRRFVYNHRSGRK